jgi:hypothetical protein
VAALGLFVGLAYARSRRAALSVSAAYFLVALWPMVGAAGAFFGPRHTLEGIALWLCSAILLCLPFALAWHPRSVHRSWRMLSALLVFSVPPLGYVALASPLTAAGTLLPGTGWCGLAATLAFCLLLVCRPVPAVVLTLATFAWSHRHEMPRLAPPTGWAALNTHLGTGGSPGSQFEAGETLRRTTLSTRARVLVFPESVIHRWTLADEAFWNRTFYILHAEHRTVLIGAQVPVAVRRRSAYNSPPLMWNGVIVRGAQQAFYAQRIPVPIGMWGRDTQPYWRGSGTMAVDGKRAGVLICWEQLLVWPVLQSMAKHPDVVLCFSNLSWTRDSRVGNIQRVVTQAWGDLFHVPVLRAVNE